MQLDTDQIDVERAAAALAAARRVAVLTGAGVSAESGVPTFRASDGLWEGHRIEDVASPDGFRRDPRLVWQFYNGRRANVARVTPNPGHKSLAMLEARFGDNFTLVTQNVDGLHQSAGNKNVLEVQGSLHRTRCTECGAVRDRGLEALPDMPTCDLCGGLLRPDIVWFGEMLPSAIWETAVAAVEACDVFLVVGTSAVVHPAAGLINLARRRAESMGEGEATTVIEFNLTPTVASESAHIGLYGPSGVMLPRVLSALTS
ncbi:MAG TPA: NAD-dependent deacylase [Gemmataceae bacterium]|jgi:NAD-dependent deacetylase|nr:NAD-dependent deacylase [Gemmataceae bacterium]